MPQKIAIVEDDQSVCDLLEEMLAEAGYHTITFSEGAAALARIPQERPDAVILDIQLERREQGWTVLDMLRLDRATARIPVIICSGDRQFLRLHGSELQEVGCCILEKPFSMADLLGTIRQGLAGSACRGA